MGVSIQPKPEKGLVAESFLAAATLNGIVSIQPKPEKGLVVKSISPTRKKVNVSIQPKPEKGLVANFAKSSRCFRYFGFNPAEAREGFSRNLV